MNLETYNSPVGFAREPSDVRWRWISRIALFVFIVILGFLLYSRVIKTQDDTDRRQEPIPTSTLPGGV